MANKFVREPTPGGDTGVWDLYELPQNRAASNGVNTCQLYNDSGTLKLKAGVIGINNGSQNGVFEIDTETTISLSGISNSNWAKIEVAISGTLPVFSAGDISSQTNPYVIPSQFTAAYDAEKGGYYIETTKRTLGVVWVNGSGVLEGVVNCGSHDEGYDGYSTSDDASDYYIAWLYGIGETSRKPVQTVTYAETGAAHTITYTFPNLFLEFTRDGTARVITFPDATASDNVGQRITIKVVGAGAGNVSLASVGGQTLGGQTAIDWDFDGTGTVIFVSDGVNWELDCNGVWDSGSNANGNWEKKTDRIMKVTGTFEDSLVMTTAAAGFYSSTAAVVTFPVGFGTAPTAANGGSSLATAYAGGGPAVRIIDSATTVALSNLMFYRGTSSGGTTCSAFWSFEGLW